MGLLEKIGGLDNVRPALKELYLAETFISGERVSDIRKINTTLINSQCMNDTLRKSWNDYLSAIPKKND